MISVTTPLSFSRSSSRRSSRRSRSPGRTPVAYTMTPRPRKTLSEIRHTPRQLAAPDRLNCALSRLSPSVQRISQTPGADGPGLVLPGDGEGEPGDDHRVRDPPEDFRRDLDLG